MNKKRICLHCSREIYGTHLKDGELRFCSSDCKNDHKNDLPPNVSQKFIKDILED